MTYDGGWDAQGTRATRDFLPGFYEKNTGKRTGTGRPDGTLPTSDQGGERGRDVSLPLPGLQTFPPSLGWTV